jgi:hypothetical protein
MAWVEVVPTFEVDVEEVMAKEYSLPCFVLGNKEWRGGESLIYKYRHSSHSFCCELLEIIIRAI